MNITKVLAEEVANKMVEPLEKKINLLHDEQVRNYGRGDPKIHSTGNHRLFSKVSVLFLCCI